MPKIPSWLVPAMLILSVLALVPVALIARARTTHSTTPRINLVPDMDYQPKYLPQTENDVFLDRRAMRPDVEGTVARGELRPDDHLYRGRVGDAWATTMPITVTSEVMARGRERFGIHCAPCHGEGGRGDGMIARRGDELATRGEANWIPPTSIHDETVREREVGHLYNTITHGIRNMPAYGSQLSVDDRWAVVAYVRALQRSSRSSIDDVPSDRRDGILPAPPSNTDQEE